MLFLLFALLDRWLVPPPAVGRCHWLTRSIYAHRGFHDAGLGRVENSPSAFAAAIAAGLGIECDVQCSRDGQALVYHDDTLDRLTGQAGRLADTVAAHMSLKLSEKQKVLEIPDVRKRLEHMLAVIEGEVQTTWL